MVESTSLLKKRTPKGYRGFESHPDRFKPMGVPQSGTPMGLKRFRGGDSVRFEVSSSELRKTEQREVNPSLTVLFIINDLRRMKRSGSQRKLQHGGPSRLGR